MAVETLILRPVSGRSTGGVYPTTVDKNAGAHLCVCEEVADGDATYVTVVATSGSAGTCFTVNVPDAYRSKTPLDIRMVMYARSPAVDASLNRTRQISTRWGYVNTSNTLTFETGPKLELTTEYQKFVESCASNANFQGIWECLKRSITGTLSASNSNFGVSAGGSNDGTKSVSDIRLTQVYLEVDFEVEDTPTPEIHVKRNGTWLGVTQQFQKVNGAWAEIAADEAKEILASNSIVTS